MEIRITKRDVAWGYIAHAFNVGSGIILLPFILRMLSNDMYGVWTVFLTLSNFVLILDFGLQPTFTRNVNYIFGGARRLLPLGIDTSEEPLEEANIPLLKNIISTMRSFYRSTSLVVGLLLMSLGSWFIHYKTGHLVQSNEILWAWGIYIISTMISFYFTYYNSLLLGRGMIKEYNQTIITTKSTYMLFAIVGLLLGYGLIAVALANLLSVIVNRVFAHYFFNRDGMRDRLRNSIATVERLMPILWVNARKSGIIGIFGFATQQGNTLLVSIYLPLAMTGSFGLSMQLTSIIATIAPLFLSTHLPQINQYRVSNNIEKIRKIIGQSMVVFWGIAIVCGGSLILLGNYLLEMVDSKTLLLPAGQLLTILVIKLLESNHSAAASLIATGNEIPFLKSSIFAGSAMALSSLLILQFTSWGIWGITISSGIIQLLYNNWKWPRMVALQMGMSYLKMMRNGFRMI